MVLYRMRPTRATEYPRTCTGVICAPKMSTEPVMSRMSLNTPASVSTSPLPAPTRKTAAMFSRNAIAAFDSKIRGLGVAECVSPPAEERRRKRRVDAPDAHDLVEGRETLGEGQDEEVDQRAHRCVVVQRHERVHLHAVQEDLDHHQP